MLQSRRIRVITAAMLLMYLVGCGGGSNDAPEAPVMVDTVPLLSPEMKELQNQITSVITPWSSAGAAEPVTIATNIPAPVLATNSEGDIVALALTQGGELLFDARSTAWALVYIVIGSEQRITDAERDALVATQEFQHLVDAIDQQMAQGASFLESPFVWDAVQQVINRWETPLLAPDAPAATKAIANLRVDCTSYSIIPSYPEWPCISPTLSGNTSQRVSLHDSLSMTNHLAMDWVVESKSWQGAVVRTARLEGVQWVEAGVTLRNLLAPGRLDLGTHSESFTIHVFQDEATKKANAKALLLRTVKALLGAITVPKNLGIPELSLSPQVVTKLETISESLIDKYQSGDLSSLETMKTIVQAVLSESGNDNLIRSHIPATLEQHFFGWQSGIMQVLVAGLEYPVNLVSAGSLSSAWVDYFKYKDHDKAYGICVDSLKKYAPCPAEFRWDTPQKEIAVGQSFSITDGLNAYGTEGLVVPQPGALSYQVLSGSNVVTLNNGLVTGIGPGSASIQIEDQATEAKGLITILVVEVETEPLPLPSNPGGLSGRVFVLGRGTLSDLGVGYLDTYIRGEYSCPQSCSSEIKRISARVYCNVTGNTGREEFSTTMNQLIAADVVSPDGGLMLPFDPDLSSVGTFGSYLSLDCTASDASYEYRGQRYPFPMSGGGGGAP